MRHPSQCPATTWAAPEVPDAREGRLVASEQGRADGGRALGALLAKGDQLVVEPGLEFGDRPLQLAAARRRRLRRRLDGD